MRHDFDAYIERRNTDCAKYGEKLFPDDVLPMWLADTDFLSPKEVQQALLCRAEHGIYGYVMRSGRLQRAVCAWVEERFQWPVQPEEAAYFPGVIPGVICAIRAMSKSGDGVIILTPSYPPFAAAIKSNGRKVISCPLYNRDGRYELDLELLETLCRSSENRLLILCNPHNPTGRVFSEAELLDIGNICLRHKVSLISDEIHSDIIYSGSHHTPIAKLCAGSGLDIVTFYSPSKTFNIPGLNTSAGIASSGELLERLCAELFRNKGTHENIFGTVAFCTCYERCSYYADELVEYLTGNRAILLDAVSNIPGIRPVAPEGTYLMWLDCRELGLEQPELVRCLIQKAKLGLQDGMEFGAEGKGYMRMNFAVPRVTLQEAIKRLKTIP